MAARAPALPKKKTVEENPTEEQIRIRAYEIYVDQGRKEGMDVENWLQAEAELREAAK